MVVEKSPKVNPPSGRVPGQGLLVILISGLWRRRNNGENRVTVVLPRIFRIEG